MNFNLLYSLCLSIFFCSACNNKIQETKVYKEDRSSIKIAFGSCSDEDKDQKLWKDIILEYPNMWIWLGDNIYGDSEDENVLKEKYDLQKSHLDYQILQRNTTILATWDDHDYGINDGGKEHKNKKGAQKAFLEFIDAPKTDVRWTRPGIYQSFEYTANGILVNVILLDTRTFRDELIKQDYVCQPNYDGSILGDEQWAWLEYELNHSTADINVIASSIQAIPTEHRFEKWENFPNDRKRFFDLITESDAKYPIIISGDRHIGEISKLEWKGKQIYDITSSSLTHGWKTRRDEANKHRHGDLVYNENYGVIEIKRSNKNDFHIEVCLKSADQQIESSITIQ